MEEDEINLRNRRSKQNSSPLTHNYGSAAEYAEAVRTWIWAYHNWYFSRCFANFYFQQQQNHALTTSNQRSPPQFISPPTVQNGSIPNVQNQNIPLRGTQYVIPTLGRRLLAEIIDFFLCFILSLFVTYVLVEVNIIDIEKYEKVFNNEADLKTFIDITQDLFPIEIAKRLITSFLEAIYLSGGLGTVPAGRTPGKFLMGLKVISCQNIQPVSPRDYRVIVETSRERITFANALIRSLIKNFALGFLFPLCIAMYMFQFNRALYDIAAGTVVVEA